MSRAEMMGKCGLGLAVGFAALLLGASAAQAQVAAPERLVTPALVMRPADVVAGPYNGAFLAGGLGLSKRLDGHAGVTAAQAGWAMSLWFKTADAAPTTLLAGIGRPDGTYPRYLALVNGRAAFWAGGAGAGHELSGGGAALTPGTWHLLAVSVDAAGVTHLYADGAEVASGELALGPAADTFEMAPTAAPWPVQQGPASPGRMTHFGGHLAQVSLLAAPLSAQQVVAMSGSPAGLDELPFEDGSRAWPVQIQGPAGMKTQQDPSLLPHSTVPPQAPHAVAPLAGMDEPTAEGSALVLRHGWRLADAASVQGGGAQISAASYKAASWMVATVPGTVLTTLIDRGVYPDPDYGLNNMAIPESLSKKSFWYRTELTPPAAMRGHRLSLTFAGINYRATIWVNGTRAGQMVGAFEARSFDVTGTMKAGERNVIAVLIEPPPHGGIAHEQSLAAGSGDNGGVMMLDGPTFSATEGWDWIPGIRDRNMGLWQDVTLTATGEVTLGSPQIITKIALPDRSRAELTLHVPLENTSAKAIKGVLEVGFDDVHLARAVTVPPGGMVVDLLPKDEAKLTIQNPRLWWPNGYGKPELHTLSTEFKIKGRDSDKRQDRFGMREMTYELSALDTTGHLRRVEYEPTVAKLMNAGVVVEQTHEGFRETPKGWVTSLAPGAESSPAIKAVADTAAEPFLIVRVNGVKIAIKGGAWGMDDMRKRVSRERLEPYFRLHREANVNMIRNWMGQDTEEVFYDLADENGMLVWNDFWLSTQDWNLEADDATLFLNNARDTIRRFRNHPSIAVWCGRNEGVPPPTINAGLAKLTSEEDGTRYYSADSNKINLHDSGPYKYQEPEDYFTKLSLGFAVEVGVASPPTLEAFQAFLPKADQWPISDAWAYHDWHQGGNGATEPFMETMAEEFGQPTSLEDFDRKAQMLNYEAHRAIFEGFNAKLWAPNSGRLLWMTQPAWPSTEWQIFSHDYDTQASYYAVKKAAEQIHVQMNLPEHDLAVVNNSEVALSGLHVRARVMDTAGKVLLDKTATLDARANATSAAGPLDVHALLESEGVLLVKLELMDAAGKTLSDNFYWLGATKSAYRKLGLMTPVTLTLAAKSSAAATGETQATVTLTNTGSTVAVETKLTLLDAVSGERILPAYLSDNYVAVLPGESKVVTIAYPTAAAQHGAKIAARGWNVTAASVAVMP